MSEQPASQPTDERPKLHPHRVKRSGSSVAWLLAILAALVLAALIVFIAQNASEVHVRFLMLHAKVALGLALLIAGLLGALLVFVVGGWRIFELRRVARRHSQEDVAAVRGASERSAAT